MKRSEMVQEIEGYVYNIITEYKAGTTMEELISFYGTEILETIESLGMIPPPIEFMMGNMKIRDNGWDKEDKL